MDRCVDNCMEWITGQKVGGVTFSQQKFVSKIKKYAEDFPDDVKIIAENEDGSIYAKVPISWFKFSPPRKRREMTDEEREAAAERLRDARAKRRSSNEVNNP